MFGILIKLNQFGLISFFRLACVFVFLSVHGFCQTVLDSSVHDLKTEALPEFLHRLEQSRQVKAFYLDEWLSVYEVGPHFNGFTIRRVLDELLVGSGVTYEFLFGYALIFSKDPASAILRESILNHAIVQRKAVMREVIGVQANLKPGETLWLRGTVRDQDTGAFLEGASISINDAAGNFSDVAGRFQVPLLPGSHVVTIRRPQYDDKIIDLAIYESGQIDIDLQESPVMLGEVVIAEDLILEKAIGKTSLNMAQMKRAPVFLGEVDVIKQVQAQPGVTTVGEMASGFNVRGGGVDQNLVLYDDVPIFNTSHALGFFTAFNPEAIGSVSFYRGGIPAQFGGRVSSVLEIGSLEGDFKKWTGGGGLGIISSHLTLGGPIKKDTTSAIVSIRSTYSDWMLKAISSAYEDLSQASVRFYDGSIKLTHRISHKGKLTFSGYRSRDRFSLSDDTTYHWGNQAMSMRLDHAIASNLFSTLSIAYGQYDFMVKEEDPATAFELKYSVTYPSLKVDFQLEGKHSLSFGFHNTWYRFDPGALNPSSGSSNVVHYEMESEKSLETAVYVGDSYSISETFFAEAGIRLSMFSRLGPVTVYKYRSNAPKEVHNIQDSVVYKNGEISTAYMVPEPRISLRYTLGDNSALKLGYHRMAQYVHLVTNTAAMTPMDIWQSSNTHFKPQVADQLSVGLFQNFFGAMFQCFVEIYYKEVRNTLDYKDGANLILNPYLETALIPTTGTSYGIELSVSKEMGRLQGAVNYTYSRSFRQGDGLSDREQINYGKKYPANNDQPHIANTNWRYAISRRIFFSGNFVYHTGRPVSMPSAAYEIDGVPVSNFPERNQYRIPDYHRLDIALIVEGNHKRKKRWSGHWIFSFYNVYCRKNAYSVYFADDGAGTLNPYKLSVIGTVIPSVSYSFKF